MGDKVAPLIDTAQHRAWCKNHPEAMHPSPLVIALCDEVDRLHSMVAVREDALRQLTQQLTTARADALEECAGVTHAMEQAELIMRDDARKRRDGEMGKCHLDRANALREATERLRAHAGSSRRQDMSDDNALGDAFRAIEDIDDAQAEAFAVEALALAEAVKPALAGKHPAVQGAALAELMATYLLGHWELRADGQPDRVLSRQRRRVLLESHLETVLQLVAHGERAEAGR